MLRVEESDLLRALMRAARAPGDWPALCAALAGYFTADDVQLYGLITAQTLPEICQGLRLGRVYTGEELADRAGQSGPGDARALGLAAQAGPHWLVLSRARGNFRASQSAALASFAPHLTEALDLGADLLEAQARDNRQTQVLRRLGVGLVQFDPTGRIVQQDATARALLADAPALPRPLHPGLHRLSRAIDLLCSHGEAGQMHGILRSRTQPLPEATILAPALGLTLAEARLARALGMGARLNDAALRLGLTRETARFYSKQIFAKTGTSGQPDLMRKLWTGGVALMSD